jgi:hypothetical protein
MHAHDYFLLGSLNSLYHGAGISAFLDSASHEAWPSLPPFCSVTGKDKPGVPAGITRLLSPKNDTQLHFAQYGGYLQVANLQLQGRAGRGGGGGGVLIKQSKDGAGDDGQPATFAADLVTFT